MLNRIQKLLFSEYCEFEDMVLVESPFAETTRDGRGIRQVQLGLTPTKLVFATDVIPSANESSVWCSQNVDPEIETFELISVYPVDCVNLSVFRRNKRQCLKAHFCNNRVLYFELGGFEKRNMFWNLWCERVKFLSPEVLGSSHSETSIASSTSNSTMYLVGANKFFPNEGPPQLWCTFGAGDNYDSRRKWTEKNLFMGGKVEDIKAGMMLPIAGDSIMDIRTIYRKRSNFKRTQCSIDTSYDTLVTMNTSIIQFNPLPTQRLPLRVQHSQYLYDKFVDGTYKSTSISSSESTDVHKVHSSSDPSSGLQMNLTDLANAAVEMWETATKTVLTNIVGNRNRHRRRYAFGPQLHFHYGLGPWNVTAGERFSVQMKRAVSVVGIHRQPADSELRLPISKRQLIASISYEALIDQPRSGNGILIKKKLPSEPFTYFWTPEYWYRPRTSKDVYLELQNHLQKVREHLHKNMMNKVSKHGFFRRKKRKNATPTDIILLSDDETIYVMPEAKSRKFIIRNRSKGSCHIIGSIKNDISKSTLKKETSVQFLRRVLRLDLPLTAWDFDSTTMAYQLTMIDRELFLKITIPELGVLLWQQSSKNAPNVSAFIAFSQRVSCLVASEILKEDVEKLRARLIARFITTADKCNKIFNFQSCRSVLSGLQSPPIYRLHKTWAYVRQKHSSKYQLFEKLCRLYRDPRMPEYQRAFHRAKKNSPYLPYIGDLLAHLLDKVPFMSEDMLEKPSFEKQQLEDHCIELPVQTIASFHTRQSYASQESSLPNILRRFLSAFRIWPSPSSPTTPTPSDCGDQLIDTQKPQTVQVNRNIGIRQQLRDGDIINAPTEFKCTPLQYNDNRKTRLYEVSQLMRIFQKAAANYALSPSELANEYLLKARYREDRENFIHSFRFETRNV